MSNGIHEHYGRNRLWTRHDLNDIILLILSFLSTLCFKCVKCRDISVTTWKRHYISTHVFTFSPNTPSIPGTPAWPWNIQVHYSAYSAYIYLIVLLLYSWYLNVVKQSLNVGYLMFNPVRTNLDEPSVIEFFFFIYKVII